MKVLLLLLAATLYFHYGQSAMSEAQLEAAMNQVKNVCQPKFKITNEQIGALHNGDWNMDKNTKCYLWCILSMNKLITKDNAFDMETGIAIISEAPESVKGTALPSLRNCKDSVKTTSDKCEASYELAHCLYFDNPEHFFLT